MSIVVSTRPSLAPNVLKVMAKFGAMEIVDGIVPNVFQEVLILQKHPQRKELFKYLLKKELIEIAIYSNF